MQKKIFLFSILFLTHFLVYADFKTNTKQEITFLEAVDLVKKQSPKLAASKANVQSQIYQHDALKGLGGPSVLLNSTWSYYDFNFNIGLDHFRELGLDVADTIINERVPSLFKPFFSTANKTYQLTGNQYEMNLKGHAKSNNAILVWPVYTGGLMTAIKKLNSAKVEEAEANSLQNYFDVHTSLVQRYFGAQLLKQVLFLRQEAVKAIKKHDHTAQRMLEEGLISKVERLQAKVALEDAKRNAEKAKNDSLLADLALQKILNQEQTIQPKTPLFIHRNTLADIRYFKDIALHDHPGLMLVNAKKNQAKALEAANTSRWKPMVAVIGAHELSSHKPNKMLGINVSWTLFSSVNRQKMQKSAHQKVLQAQLTEQQAKDDITLLIEKNWRNVENARQSFFALQSNLDIANEYLRLRTSGLREGVNTLSDLIDAEVNLEKIKTERLKAAYDYIMALNELSSSTGKPELFEKFLQSSDIQLK